MPEGCEIKLFGDLVSKVKGFYFDWCDSDYKIQNIEMLNQARVLDVKTKGKLLEIIIEREAFPKGIWHVLFTFGMTGKLAFNTPSTDKHRHFHWRAPVQSIEVPGVKYDAFGLSFIDQRRFGKIRVVTPEEAEKIKNKIGICLMTEAYKNYDGKYYEWNGKVGWWVALRENFPKIKNKLLPEILLTQEIFSGVGNYIRAEALYRTKLAWVTVEAVSQEKWLQLYLNILNVMRESYQAGGCSLRDFDVNGKKGSFQDKLKVYGQKECPAGHKISKCKDSQGRTFWYCRECQISDPEIEKNMVLKAAAKAAAKEEQEMEY